MTVYKSGEDCSRRIESTGAASSYNLNLQMANRYLPEAILPDSERNSALRNCSKCCTHNDFPDFKIQFADLAGRRFTPEVRTDLTDTGAF